MTFANPKILWLLAIAVPLLGLFLWRSWRRKQFLIGQFVQSRMLAQLTVGVSKTLQKTRLWLMVIAVGLILFALARPQGGLTWEEARQEGLDILVAIDTSRSMLAQDLVPNRLARAKLAALDLMQLARNDRLGLIAFAGTSFLQCPLTMDEDAFRQSVNVLDVGIIPQGGTMLTDAIETATKSFGPDSDSFKVLVLFTDGEDHEPGAVAAAKEAAEAGLRIFTIGVGTPEGDLLPEYDRSGALNYVKDDSGNVVKSRLNESLLTQIANAAGGFYLPLGAPQTIEALYERGLAPLPKSEIASRMIRQLKEHYQWFLGLAILLIIIEMFLPDRKRVERTDAPFEPANAGLKTAVAALAVALLCSTTAFGSTRSAQRKYELGAYKQAHEEYQIAIEKNPQDLRLRYNAGAAAYLAKEYDRAQNHFSTTLTSPDLDLQQQAHYNLGNTYFRLGENQSELNQKLVNWESAKRQYEAALNLNPADQDSKFNLEFVEKKIEELKEQQKQQQQQQQQQQQDQSQGDEQKKEDKNGEQNSDQQQQDQGEQSDQESQPKSEGDSSKDQQQPQQSSDANEKDQENSDQQQNSSDSNQNRDEKQQEKPQQGSQPGDPSNQGGDQADRMSQSVREGQMTPEQVRRLLDAQRGEEKPLLFLPPNNPNTPRKSPSFKDW